MPQALMPEPSNTWWRCRLIATPCLCELSKLSPPGLDKLAHRLKLCGIRTVALESTGIYWIAPYEVLEQHGFEVRVVNARHVKHVPRRSKNDVLDCQWIQKLHSFGLLNGSFRPDQQIRKLRTTSGSRIIWWSTVPRLSITCRKRFSK